jgi:hypothetical protein
MMRLPPETILAGVSSTLEHDVLPALSDRSARGLIFAALEVLANVKDLVEWKTALRDEENASAARLLAARALACRSRRDMLTQRRRAIALAEADRGASGRALTRESSVRSRSSIATCAAGGRDFRAALRTHLVNQTPGRHACSARSEPSHEDNP